MPLTPSYPGVYISEEPSATRTIVGVTTSVTAFVGYFMRGPDNTAIRIASIGDFQQIFGGLAAASQDSYAVAQFFLNGGGEAWIVRTAASTSLNPFVAASSTLLVAPAGATALIVSASSKGSWGNNLVLDVNYASVNSASEFNMTVIDATSSAGEQVGPVLQIVARNLSIDSASPRFVLSALGAASNNLLACTVPTGVSPQRPAQTGLVGGDLTTVSFNGIDSATMQPSINGTVLNDGNGTPYSIGGLPAATTLATLAPALQAAIRQVPELASTVVQLINNQLRIQITDLDYADDLLTFNGSLASTLLLSGNAAVANAQYYVLGSGTAGAQGSAVSGGDGLAPGAVELIGSSDQRTGMYALDAVDIINLLSIPSVANLSQPAALLVIVAAENYCEGRLAFYIADMASGVTTPQQAAQWISDNGIASAYAAIYFPSLVIADPLTGGTRVVPPSGTLAGVYARNDAKRAVWVAPAGIDASLKGVVAPSYRMTDDQNGIINQLGVNALRNFPVYGNVSWGARTTDGADARASQWKYIPVRRTALYIEQSLKRGLQWVVFEPNGPVLWSQIRLNVGAFMHSLFQQNAFQGQSPNQAYLVNCGEGTTSSYDIDRGIIIIEVGFAPLKPAEFVIITLQQLTVGSQT
jgi:phage tail sheath protein FI